MRLFRFLLPLLLVFAVIAPACAAPAKTVHMLTRTVWPLRAGQKVDCQLYLWTDDGPLSFAGMKEMHGAKLHLVLMSADYKDYYHAYPQPTGEGEFRFTLSVARKVPLRVWAIYTDDTGKHVLVGDLNGDAIQTFDSLPDTQIIQGETDAMVFTMHFPRQIRAGIPSDGMIFATLKNTRQGMTELEPVKDAYAYFTALSGDSITLSEIYPTDPPASDGAYGGPAVHFHLVPAREGMLRVMVQMHARGEDMLVPFTLRVAPTAPPGHHAPDEDPDQIPSLPPDSKMGE